MRICSEVMAGPCSKVILLPIWMGLFNKSEGCGMIIFSRPPRCRIWDLSEHMDHKTSQDSQDWDRFPDVSCRMLQGGKPEFRMAFLDHAKVWQTKCTLLILVFVDKDATHSNLKGRLSLFVIAGEASQHQTPHTAWGGIRLRQVFLQTCHAAGWMWELWRPTLSWCS